LTKENNVIFSGGLNELQMIKALKDIKKVGFKSTNNQINSKDMAAKRSKSSKRAAYSRSPKTIYKDRRNTIQVVIKKSKPNKRKKSRLIIRNFYQRVADLFFI